MEFEWDEEKNERNSLKRDLAFILAARVFRDQTRITKPDKRRNYGELRYLTCGKVEGRLFAQWQKEQNNG